ncbi:MAG TPA: DUF4241 domain-containing protein [Pyrinomonadaceae bacterium]|nr:DUF4241 domain-containing protein [Pyrinomonadaceae bacterium]
MRFPDFTKLFVDGSTVESEYGEVTLSNFDAGTLTLTTGRLVACDPLFIDPTAYVRSVHPGTYPVTLSVAHFSDADQRVAAAMLRITERRPVAWEMALIAGQDINTLMEGEIYGYPVDSGTGCFMDAETAEALDDNEEFEDVLTRELNKTYVETWSWTNLNVDGLKNLNVVAFSSGMGEGLYASYFGLDEDNAVACVVTDFALF